MSHSMLGLVVSRIGYECSTAHKTAMAPATRPRTLHTQHPAIIIRTASQHVEHSANTDLPRHRAPSHIGTARSGRIATSHRPSTRGPSHLNRRATHGAVLPVPPPARSRRPPSRLACRAAARRHDLGERAGGATRAHYLALSSCASSTAFLHPSYTPIFLLVWMAWFMVTRRSGEVHILST